MAKKIYQKEKECSNKLSDGDLNQHFALLRIFERRNKILIHNNYCVLETIMFYENVFLNNIIRPYLFSENYDKYPEVANLINDRLNFIDRFKIVKKIGKIYNVKDFKKIDRFIEMRNKIAHNLSSIGPLNIESKENIIFLGNEEMTWDEYIIILNEWTKLSYEIATFTKEIFIKVNSSVKNAIFMYCKTEGECVLVQHNLIIPKPDAEYISFFKNGLNMDLLEYLKEEIEYKKGSE